MGGLTLGATLIELVEPAVIETAAPTGLDAQVSRVMATGSPGSLGDAHVSRVLDLDSGLNTRLTCASS